MEYGENTRDPRVDECTLEAAQIGREKGFWLWRSALYTVYQVSGDGERREIFTGRFRNGSHAADSVRDLFGLEYN